MLIDDNVFVTFTFACNLLQLVRFNCLQEATRQCAAAAVVFSLELVKSEVRQLNNPAGVHQAVGGLEVTVNSYRGIVKVRHALQKNSVANCSKLKTNSFIWSNCKTDSVCSSALGICVCSVMHRVYNIAE